MIAYETFLTPAPSGLARRRGFTLAELMVSMVVMSILMVGLGSAIYQRDLELKRQSDAFHSAFMQGQSQRYARYMKVLRVLRAAQYEASMVVHWTQSLSRRSCPSCAWPPS